MLRPRRTTTWTLCPGASPQRLECRLHPPGGISPSSRQRHGSLLPDSPRLARSPA
jgi:hypothetical protein